MTDRSPGPGQVPVYGQVFRRPAGRFTGWISGPLGSLPVGMARIVYSRAEFAEARSYWWAAAAAVLVVYGAIFTVVTSSPVLGTSPVTLVAGSDLGTYVIMAVMTVLLLAVGVVSRRTGGIRARVFQAATMEEQWFRSGAEGWTWRQRVYSCVSFGFVHLFNLIYTVAAAGLLIGVGVMFMIIYLRELRVTGDVRKATIAAAKCHGTYNLITLGILAMAVPLFWGLTGWDLVAAP